MCNRLSQFSDLLGVPFVQVVFYGFCVLGFQLWIPLKAFLRQFQALSGEGSVVWQNVTASFQMRPTSYLPSTLRVVLLRDSKTISSSLERCSLLL